MKFSEITNDELKILIKEIKNNNERSLIQIIKLFDPFIKFLVKNFNKPDLYDELMSELLYLLIEINLEKNNLKGYLKVCLLNFCKKDYSRSLKEKTGVFIENFSTERDSIETELLEKKLLNFKKEKEKILNEISESMADNFRKIFLAYYVEEVSIYDLTRFYNLKKSRVYEILRITTIEAKQNILKKGVI